MKNKLKLSFDKEARYVVFAIDDLTEIDATDNNAAYPLVTQLQELVNSHRFNQNQPERKFVCVSDKYPEQYTKAWNLVQDIFNPPDTLELLKRELINLDQKRFDLKLVKSTAYFKSLDEVQRILIRKQIEAMDDYSEILKIRIHYIENY